MRRTKEILRPRRRRIARSLSISVGTVHDYLPRAEAAGFKWPPPKGWDDGRLESALFQQPVAPGPPRKILTGPWAWSPASAARLCGHPSATAEGAQHVTLQLLWEEYQEADSQGYRYSRFCELYRLLARRARRSLNGAQAHRTLTEGS